MSELAWLLLCAAFLIILPPFSSPNLTRYLKVHLLLLFPAQKTEEKRYNVQTTIPEEKKIVAHLATSSEIALFLLLTRAANSTMAAAQFNAGGL